MEVAGAWLPREKSNAVRVGTIPGIFQDFHFSKNTEHMYLLTERLGYIPNKLSVQTIFDGTVVCESSLQNILRIHASPDGQSGIAVVTPGRGGATLNMLDSQTLDTLWSSPCRGGIRQIAYRQDGLVLAATWFIPNELFGSTAGVKAWNKSGTVVLDEQISHWNKDELSFTPEGCLQAGTHLFTPITP